MNRTSHLDAEITVRDPLESEGPEYSLSAPEDTFVAAELVEGAARREGEVLFRAEGPDAEEAIAIVRDLLDGETATLAEASAGMLNRPFDFHAVWASQMLKVRENLEAGRPWMEGVGKTKPTRGLRRAGEEEA